MAIPNRALILTKAEAATRQVESAIDALDRGDFDVAVTLAGAAEGMFEREGLTLFAFLMNRPKVAHLNRKDWLRHLNQARDWLKHCGPPKAMEIGLADAAVMIARAATKLEAADWTSKIDAFRAWYIANLDEIMK